MALGQITITDMTDREAICVPGTIFVPVNANKQIEEAGNSNFKICLRQGATIVDKEFGIIADNTAILPKNFTLTINTNNGVTIGNLAWALPTPIAPEQPETEEEEDGNEEETPEVVPTPEPEPEIELASEFNISIPLTCIINGAPRNFTARLTVVLDANAAGAYVEKIVRYDFISDFEPTVSPTVDSFNNTTLYYDEENKTWVYPTEVTIDDEGYESKWSRAYSGVMEYPYYFELYLYSNHTTKQVSEQLYDIALAEGQKNRDSVTELQNFMNWISERATDEDGNVSPTFQLNETFLHIAAKNIFEEADKLGILAQFIESVVYKKNEEDGTIDYSFFDQASDRFGFKILGNIESSMKFTEEGLDISKSSSRYSVLVSNDGVYIRRKEGTLSEDTQSYVVQSRFSKQQLTIPEIRVAIPGQNDNSNESGDDDLKRYNFQLAPDGGMILVMETAAREERKAITTNNSSSELEGGN